MAKEDRGWRTAFRRHTHQVSDGHCCVGAAVLPTPTVLSRKRLLRLHEKLEVLVRFTEPRVATTTAPLPTRCADKGARVLP